tara:strand:+ start:263 stop:529 length:267 start_codon:yes stop_codon:yes gene_type:complete
MKNVFTIKVSIPIIKYLKNSLKFNKSLINEKRNILPELLPSPDLEIISSNGCVVFSSKLEFVTKQYVIKPKNIGMLDKNNFLYSLDIK